MKTESTLIIVISVILLPFLVFSGCGRRGADTSHGFFWEPVDPEVDSLVAQFDTLFYGSRNGRIADSIVARLESIAQHTDNPSIRARSYYLRGVCSRFKGKSELQVIYIDSALQLSDPKAHPYEYARIILFKPMPNPDAATHYAELQNDCDVFKEVGDSTHVADAYNRMAAYHEYIGDHANAIKFLNLALEYFPQKQKWGRFLIAYNLALNYENLDDSVNARAIIDTLRISEMRKQRDDVNAMIMWLSYRLTGDVADLNEAFDAASKPGYLPFHKPFIAALLTKHYLKAGMLDSARRYGTIVRAEMKKFLNHYDDMLLASAMLYEADGMTDSAAELRRQYEEEIQRLNSIKAASEMTRRGTREQIEALEAQLSETDDHKQTVMWVLVVVILVASGIVAFILLKRHHNDHDRHRMKKRLEQHDRRLSVAEIKIADKKRQMDEIAECLTSIKGPVPPEVSRLLAQMKTNSVDEVDWETISLLFAELNPEFKRRLHEKHPDLTASYVRLASLIYLGLGTKHIARLLAINPDSVKKSRQRLRAKLGLTPDIATETYLWELANGKI